MEYRKLEDGEILRAECGCFIRTWDESVVLTNGQRGGTFFDPCEEHEDYPGDHVSPC